MLEMTNTLRDEVLEITQSLVRIKSYSGDEGQVIDLITGWMGRLGYKDIRLDDNGNVVGKLTNQQIGAVTLFDSHVDTVPAADTDQWTYPPFSGEVVGDRIYGRGTTDMKGPLAACLVGVAQAHRDGAVRGTVFVSASTGEEHIEGLTLNTVIDYYQPDRVVICEPTALKLATAQRGRAEIEIVVHGKSAHASSPHIGVNAFRNMARLVVALDQITPPEDPQLGKGILEPTTVISSPYPNVSVIPFACHARYDRRLLVGESAEDVLEPIQAVIDQLHAEDPTFNATAQIVQGTFTCYTGTVLHQETFAPAWRMDESHPFVSAARSALNDVKLSHYSFCTNGSYTLGRRKIPTLGYGPGYEHTAHTADEYLDLDQLFGAVQGYYALAAMG